MGWFIIGTILLVLNGWFAVKDVERGNTTKSAAFSWFVVGWLAFDMLKQIIVLLS